MQFHVCTGFPTDASYISVLYVRWMSFQSLYSRCPVASPTSQQIVKVACGLVTLLQIFMISKRWSCLTGWLVERTTERPMDGMWPAHSGRRRFAQPSIESLIAQSAPFEHFLGHKRFVIAIWKRFLQLLVWLGNFWSSWVLSHLNGLFGGSTNL